MRWCRGGFQGTEAAKVEWLTVGDTPTCSLELTVDTAAYLELFEAKGIIR